MLTIVVPPNKHKWSKTEFERILNDQPVPEKIKRDNPTIRIYGRWLRTNHPAKFQKLYEQWLSENYSPNESPV